MACQAESAERAELREDCDGNYPNVRRGEMWSYLINIQHLCFRRCDPLNRYIVTSGGISLLRNRGLAAKDILLELAGGCFRQLGHKLDSLGTLEVRQLRCRIFGANKKLKLAHFVCAEILRCFLQEIRF